MIIAFLPEDRRAIGNQRINKNIENLNEDAFWIASIIRDVPPDYNTYLYLVNPKTDYSIIHKLEGNWKKDIKSNIVKAFRRELETLKEKGISIGRYEDLLGKINFSTIPKKYLNTVEDYKRSRDDFLDIDLNLDVPEEKFVSDYEVESFNFRTNTQKSYSSSTTPLIRLNEVFRNYQQPSQKREVDFEKNLEALRLPENFPIIDSDEPWKLKDKVTAMDTTFLVTKEPVELNQSKIDSINRKIMKLARQQGENSNPRQLKRTREKMNALIEEMNQYLSYYQSPFTGEYAELEVPEKLPENPVFEFIITLDTGAYLAMRRVAVSGDMLFTDFDKLLLHLYRWTGFPYHMSEFLFPLEDDPEGKEISEILVWQDEDMPVELWLKPVDSIYLTTNNPFYNVPTSDIKGKVLKEYFPKFKTAQYRYDLGDNWFHSIELVGIYDQDEFDKPLPYLIDSVGVAPIEDIGGPPAFESFIKGDYDFFEDREFLALSDAWFEERDKILQSPGTLAPLFEDSELND